MLDKFYVGLAGPIGSGKDTLANLLVDTVGSTRTATIKFADPLYDMMHALDMAYSPSMSHRDKEAPLLGDPSLPSRRHAIQTAGTEWGRNLIHPMLWVKLAHAKARSLDVRLVIFSDVRFEDEAALIREHGLIVHLDPSWPCPRTEHASEAGLERKPEDLVLSLKAGHPHEAIAHILATVNRALDADGRFVKRAEGCLDRGRGLE